MKLEGYPLVSCLMCSRRPDLATQSIDMFLCQTYKNKELIIMVDTEEQKKDIDQYIYFDLQGVLNINVHVTKHDVLGKIRNEGIELSKGEFICVWDDDDIYSPERISTQLEAIYHHNKPACTLSRTLLYFEKDKECFLSKIQPFGWEMTLLCEKKYMPKYSEIQLGEDTQLLIELGNRQQITIIEGTYLYCYVYHDENAYPKQHYVNNITQKINLSNIKTFVNLIHP